MIPIVSVAAAGNGSGKTTLLCRILSAFPGRLAAVKFTTVYRDGVNCPRNGADCACRTLRGPYTMVEDPRVLNASGTDTSRLAEAGARRVLWCLARPGAHEKAWADLRERLIPLEPALVTEGNTIVPLLRPGLLVMVVSPGVPRDRWKPDTLDLIAAADLVVVNRHGAASIADLIDEVASARGGRPPLVQDLSAPLGAWEDSSLHEGVTRLIGAGR